MKKLKYLLFAIFAVAAVTSCIDDDNDELTGGAATGGLISINDPLVIYVVQGDVPADEITQYEISGSVVPSPMTTNTVNVYKTFEGKDGSSNRVLLETVPVTDGVFSFVTDYPALREGLTYNGGALPAFDTGLSIGDKFVLEYESVLSDGSTSLNALNAATSTSVAVSTRLAGIYSIQRGWYIHPSTAPGLAGDYTGAYNRVIESVDLTADYAVYKSTTMGWGPAGGWDDPNCNFFFFFVSNTPNGDGTFDITIPKEYDGTAQTLWCSDELANCINDPGNLPDVSCGTLAVLNDDGHDEIRLSYGYIRSSGTRQFDEILIKQ